MPDFNRNKRFSGPRRFDKRPGSFGPREMYDAECANCKRMTQVPFRPNGKKPVFCKDCFRPEEDGRERVAPRGNDRMERREPAFVSAPQAPDRRIDDLKRQMDNIQAALERLVTVVEESNRKASLTKEVRRHVTAPKPAAAPVARATKSAAKRKPARKA